MHVDAPRGTWQVLDKASSVADWTWHKQLRYYTKGAACAVKMAEAHMDYSFEYQGNAPKLVRGLTQ
jgi:dynein heavy chain 2